MIRPISIDIENHKADFVCSIHKGSVTALDLNTSAEYNDANTDVVISGAVLSPTCACVTYFPISNGNKNAQDIAAAKTE